MPHTRFLTLLLIAASASCSPRSAPRGDAPRPIPAGQVAEKSEADTPPAKPPARAHIEPWTYDGVEGRLISTDSYRIFTTTGNESFVERFPLFMESARAHYASAVTPLPMPKGAGEVYLMGSRMHWESLTQRLMGSDAGQYLQIQRGGFAANGRAILYDIGRRDTYTIAAHEGWHQFTQRTFRDQLPVSIEEGLATYMEGFRWEGESRSVPRFMPWRNFERFSRLRECVQDNETMSLSAVLASAPQDVMSGGQRRVLDYYAHVWAMTQFFMEGQEGTLREGFQRMVRDAAEGTLGQGASVGGRIGGWRRRGGAGALVEAYLGKTPQALDPAFQRFIRDIATLEAPRFMMDGKSPLAKETPP
jgi:hypothetical protein